MFSRTIKIGLVLCLMVFGAAAELNAQEAMTPEKRELIRQLLETTNARQNAEAILEAMLQQNERELPKLLSQAVPNDESLTPAEREEVERKVNESVTRTNRRVRELFQQRINFAQLIEDTSYSLYDKYFTEGEIRDLTAFYQSPTGKKSIEVMPKLFSDSMAKTAEVLMPKMQQIMKEVTDEEMERLAKAPPPPAKKVSRARKGRRR